MNFVVLVLSQVLIISLVRGQFRDVTTDQGIVRGHTLDADDVYSFYGIPYATAPSGEDRFKASLPPPTWDDIFNATETQILCPQVDQYPYETTIITNCLRLHVFVPDTQERNLPVLFYIHGGGHQNGHPGMYSPLHLVRRGMIVVNFNYRVGVYGFLCLNTEFAPGNAGAKDQIAALRWVQRNIANFGGDPNRITVGGSSSGSVCVELQILSSLSNSLFHRAFSVGGGATEEILVFKDPLLIAENYALQFGVSTNQNISRLESFYRSLSDDQLNTVYQGNHKEIGFTPCVETHNLPGVEKFLTEDPVETLLNNNYDKIPYLSGFTPMDGLEYLGVYDDWKPLMETNFTDFIPASLAANLDAEQIQTLRDFYLPAGDITMMDFVYYFTDIIFSYPMYSAARLHARNGASVYLYMFSYNGTVNLPSAQNLPIWGPGHVTPLLYMQEHIQNFIYENMTAEEYVIQDRLLDLYYHFIRDGVPTTNLVDVIWLPVSSEAEYLHMDSEFVMDNFPIRDRMEAWDRLYNYPYNAIDTDSAVTSSLSVIALVFSVVAITFNTVFKFVKN